MQIEVRADGDEFVVSAEAAVDGERRYGTFESAVEVAQSLAAELGGQVVLTHPRNPSLRRLEA